MRVVSVQLDIPAGETKAKRVERAARLVESLAGADLVVLPEIWNVGYFRFDRYAKEAEAVDGPTVSRLAAAAESIRAWVAAGSFVERDGDRLHNTSVMLDRAGGVAGTYRKIHLFGYGSREPEVLTPGNRVSVVDTEFGRVGMATCYDLRFPELFRAMVDDGAQGFVVPSAWPYPRVEAWAVLNRARPIENQAWLVSSNCTGGSSAAGYCGRSMVVDPWGTALASGGDRPGLVTADLDPEETARARAEFPALRDRVLRRAVVGKGDPR
ncbi:MAG TPA: carbon-nitrogen family hydrolase [Actinomycetes bacterium]|nr:carbon-nitrogen family hydrolase [Actinomycetes bacterium]